MFSSSATLEIRWVFIIGCAHPMVIPSAYQAVFYTLLPCNILSQLRFLPTHYPTATAVTPKQCCVFCPLIALQYFVTLKLWCAFCPLITLQQLAVTFKRWCMFCPLITLRYLVTLKLWCVFRPLTTLQQ